MREWRKAVRRVSAEIEARIDRARQGIKRRAGRRPPFALVAYPGFGCAARLFFVGRALEDRGVRASTATDSRLRNLANIYRRMHAGELPRARIRVEFDGEVNEVLSDSTGFFEVWLTPRPGASMNGEWREAQLMLLDPLSRRQGPVSAAARMLVPPPTATCGIISDLDDTVIRTDATNLLRMARNVLFANARTRLPFPGVAAFYQALVGGAGGNEQNPIYYVSSGPWNLYDLVHEFLLVQGIPDGPITLRRWSLASRRDLPTRHAGFKLDAIRRVLDLTPLPFILIGDSGQEDPEVYREIVHDYPGRIHAVYIRNVSRRPQRSEQIRALAAEVLDASVPLVLSPDTLELADHAAAHGWIDHTAIERVRLEAGAEKTSVTEAIAPVVIERGQECPEWARQED